jgi:preprotein translocase subunit SecE
VARNRKRAKERRARRPTPVVTGRTDGDDGTPSPIRHASPDAELAEAQMALGRPELADGEDEADEDELELEAVANGAGDPAGPGARESASAGATLPAPGASASPERARGGNRLVTFLQGSWRELQRVQWPDRRQVMQATGVVIGFVIVAGVFLGVADTLAAKLMNWILGT